VLRRIVQWRLTVRSVLETLLWLEEVLRGHRSRFIAHRWQKNHIHLSARGQPLEIEILDASKVIQKRDVEVSLEALSSHV
jgi:hypothetical protein